MDALKLDSLEDAYARIFVGGVSQGCGTAAELVTFLEHPIGGFFGGIGQILNQTDLKNFWKNIKPGFQNVVVYLDMIRFEKRLLRVHFAARES